MIFENSEIIKNEDGTFTLIETNDKIIDLQELKGELDCLKSQTVEYYNTLASIPEALLDKVTLNIILPNPNHISELESTISILEAL